MTEQQQTFPPLDTGNPFVNLTAPARLEFWGSPQFPAVVGLTIRTGNGTLSAGLTLEDLQGHIAAAMQARDMLLAEQNGGLIVPNGSGDVLQQLRAQGIRPPGEGEGTPRA